MIFERKVYKQIQEHLARKQIAVLTGIRRVGKTTILKQLYKTIDSDNKIYLDFERLDVRELFTEKNYDNIIQVLESRGFNFKKKTYLLLDEIQLLPSVISPIKYLYDHYDVKFVLTGSSSYYLKNLFSESLAGRKKIFELYPLDFGEYLQFNNVIAKPVDLMKIIYLPSEYERLKQYYLSYLKYGGFPEVVLAVDPEQKNDLLADIISSYISVDIKSLADFRDEQNIYNLIKLLAQRAGTKLDYSKLARVTGLSNPTVVSYIELFIKTYLISMVPVFTSSPDRELVKAKKLYFVDNGLLNTLADVNSGTELENSVYNQLRSYGSISYYARHSGVEIDFILNNTIAFEVKQTPTLFQLKKLQRRANSIGITKSLLVGKEITVSNSDVVWAGDLRP